MAKRRRRSKKPSLSQHIRDYLSTNPDAGPKAVVEALAKAGIRVTHGLVSNIKYGAKRKAGKKRGRPRGRPAKARVADSVSLSTLVQAKKLADALGGIDVAKTALDALAKLS